MKTFIRVAAFAVSTLLISALSEAQNVKVTSEPVSKNRKDNPVSQLLDGDANSFFAVRSRMESKSAFIIVEKFDKKSMKLVRSVEVNFGNGNFRIEKILYAQNSIFIFSRMRDKSLNKTVLNCDKISFNNEAKSPRVAVLGIPSESDETIEFDVFVNLTQTRFIIKSCHKSDLAESYATDFHALNITSLTLDWTKTVGGWLSKPRPMYSANDNNIGENIRLLGIYFDMNDDIFYVYVDNNRKNAIQVGIFPSGPILGTSATIDASYHKVFEFQLDSGFSATDICFHESRKNELIAGGFFSRDIDDLKNTPGNAGIYSFTLDLSQVADINNLRFKSKAIKKLDNGLRVTVPQKRETPHLRKYKMDNIFQVGDEFLFTGQEYTFSELPPKENDLRNKKMCAYDYQDIIVTKLNSKDSIEWIHNVTMRNSTVSLCAGPLQPYFPFISGKNMYFFYNDNAENQVLEGRKAKVSSQLNSMDETSSSNLNVASVAIVSGEMKHNIVIKNEINPITRIQHLENEIVETRDLELFLPCSASEVLLYRNESGAEKFHKLMIMD